MFGGRDGSKKIDFYRYSCMSDPTSLMDLGCFKVVRGGCSVVYQLYRLSIVDIIEDDGVKRSRL